MIHTRDINIRMIIDVAKRLSDLRKLTIFNSKLYDRLSVFRGEDEKRS